MREANVAPWLELADDVNRGRHSRREAVTSALESCWDLMEIWFMLHTFTPGQAEEFKLVYIEPTWRI